MDTIRDRLWLWGHEAGSHNNAYGLTENSRMTPLEGACYLGVPNLIMIRYDDEPTMPFDRYALPFRALKRVYWSTVGGGGRSSQEERAHVIELARRYPNIVGVFMDDFFQEPKGEGDLGVLSLDEIHAMKRALEGVGRPIKLGVTLYTHQLHLPLGPYLAQCDEVSLWTWNAPNLMDLEANLDRLEALAPHSRKLLGCYMWDYGLHRPMPVDAMARQTNTGRGWLREGRIDGMIFLASCICDLGLDAVEWTRAWIAGHGDEPVSGRTP